MGTITLYFILTVIFGALVWGFALWKAINMPIKKRKSITIYKGHVIQ